MSEIDKIIQEAEELAHKHGFKDIDECHEYISRKEKKPAEGS